MREKLRHIDSCIQVVGLFDMPDANRDVLRVLVKYHDIGRYWQYKKIGSFDDRIESHLELGA